MNIQEARRVLNAAKSGEDISQATIRAALTATGDLDCTFGVKRQPTTRSNELPSQQVFPERGPAWRPTPEQRAKAFE